MKILLVTIQSSISKSFLTAVIIGAASLAAQCAFAKGGIDSGGGGGFECPNGKTHLLDLWEGGVIQIHNPTLKIKKSNEDVRVQLRNAVAKLAHIDPVLPDRVYDLAIKLFAERQAVGPGVEIEPPRDALTNYRMAGCTPVGLMYYDKNVERLVVDEAKLSRLATNTDYAAAMLHESWYYLARTSWMTSDSVNSRKLVACLFSDSSTCLKTAELQNVDTIREDEMGPVYFCRNADIELELHTKIQKLSNGNVVQLNGPVLYQRINDRIFKRGAWAILGTMQSLRPFDYLYNLGAGETVEILNENSMTLEINSEKGFNTPNTVQLKNQVYKFKETLSCVQKSEAK